MTKKGLTVCLLNDSFPPAIDGVANAVVNYARIIQRDLGHPIVAVPDYPGVEDRYDFPVIRYPSADTTKIIGYRAGYPFSARTLGALVEAGPDIIHSHCPVMSTAMARTLREQVDVPVVFTYHTKFDIDIRRAISGHMLQNTAIKLLVDNISACDEVWVVSTAPGKTCGAWATRAIISLWRTAWTSPGAVWRRGRRPRCGRSWGSRRRYRSISLWADSCGTRASVSFWTPWPG